MAIGNRTPWSGKIEQSGQILAVSWGVRDTARPMFSRGADFACVESIALEQKSHQFLSRYRKSAGQLIEHPRPASARG